MTRQEIEKLLIRADSLLSLLWHRHTRQETVDFALRHDVEQTIGLLRSGTPKIVSKLASLEQEQQERERKDSRVLPRTESSPDAHVERLEADAPVTNMYGCTPCPRCKGEFRWPTQQGTIVCDDCGASVRNVPASVGAQTEDGHDLK